MRIAVIGTGTMGSLIVYLFSKNGHVVSSYDMSNEANDLAKSKGATVVDSPALASRDADIVFLSLPKPANVRDAVFGSGRISQSVKKGSVIIDTSTVDPTTSIEIARDLEGNDVEYMDAPILGRPAGVGSWVMPVGGKSEVFKRIKPLLEVIASKAIHVGDVGAGNKIKLINQLMFASANMVYCEVLSMAEKSGVSASRFFDVLSDSGASSVSSLFVEIGSRIKKDDFDADFSINLLEKDLALASTLIADFEGKPTITSYSLPLARMAQAAGLGERDNSAMYTMFRDLF